MDFMGYIYSKKLEWAQYWFDTLEVSLYTRNFSVNGVYPLYLSVIPPVHYLSRIRTLT